MIILGPAHGFLRARVFYSIQTRVEPQSNLILPGFLLLNNQALLGAQASLTANAYNTGARAFLFPTFGLTASALTMMNNVGVFGVTSALTVDAAPQVAVRTTTYSSAGSYTYIPPSGANNLDILLAGAGGGGGAPYGAPQYDATAGGDSTITIGATTLLARGGGAGGSQTAPGNRSLGGAGGTASGGSIANVTGSGGGSTVSNPVLTAPPGPAGGTDGLGLGIAGGAGGSTSASSYQGGGGGGPGALHSQVSARTAGKISITIGAAGSGGSGYPAGAGANGMDGIAILTWS